MPRPRKRKDLPDGLYHDQAGYRLRLPGGSIKRIPGGRAVKREDAIKAWAKVWAKEHAPAQGGTFAELVDAYERLGLPKVPAEKTRKEYARQLPKLRERWGAIRYAKTEVEASRNQAVMRPGMFTRYIDAFTNETGRLRGWTQARQDIRLVSAIFSWALARDYTLYHPVLAVRVGKSEPRRVTLPAGALAAVLPHAPLAPALIWRLDALIGSRQTDLRLLTKTQIKDDLAIRQSKTGSAQSWLLTPGVLAILESAKRLPGYHRSIYVFPGRNGTAYTEGALSRAWRRACDAAKAKADPPGSLDYLDNIQARDIRKTAINRVKALGGNTTDFAGHQDPRTTRTHYEVEPVRVVPIDGIEKGAK